MCHAMRSTADHSPNFAEYREASAESRTAQCVPGIIRSYTSSNDKRSFATKTHIASEQYESIVLLKNI